jgi:hypothetical protein
MGLPMIRPCCKGCKSIYRKECKVERGSVINAINVVMS